VESIINADRKVATYKLALIRALRDIATTSWASARWERGGALGPEKQPGTFRLDAGAQARSSIPLY
jgi:hypothetical protein